MWKSLSPVIIAIIISVTYFGTAYMPHYMKSKEPRVQSQLHPRYSHVSHFPVDYSSKSKSIYPELSSSDKGFLETKDKVVLSPAQLFSPKKSSDLYFICEVENQSDKYIKDLSLNYTIKEGDAFIVNSSARADNMTILSPQEKLFYVFSVRASCPRDDKAKEFFLKNCKIETSVNKFTPYVYTKVGSSK